MKDEKRLPLVLLMIRLSVFLFMLVWTLDKFINPEHATKVYEHFYFIGGLGSTAIAAIGIIELVILLGFLVGFQKRYTYGAVFLFHAISTLSSFKQYMEPFDHLLFFAAWPMLAACFALYILRDGDTLWVVGKKATEPT